MLVDLERVPPEGEVIDRSVPASSLPLDPSEFRLTRPVNITAKLVKTDASVYRLNGQLWSEVELACVRCLDPIALKVEEKLDLLYLPQSANVAAGGEEDRGLDDEELAVSYYRDDAIDLAHMIWEQIVLALPMKPVCKPNCQGLCPDCGVNRNTGTCSCVRDTVDPRWQSLKKLLDP